LNIKSEDAYRLASRLSELTGESLTSVVIRALQAAGQCCALSFIKRARDLGFGIKDIRELLALRHRDNACDDAKAIAAKHLASLRAKLNELVKLERIIASALDKCSGGLECPVLDIIETAGTIGKLSM